VEDGKESGGEIWHGLRGKICEGRGHVYFIMTNLEIDCDLGGNHTGDGGD
jgi:hypothetical protein